MAIIRWKPFQDIERFFEDDFASGQMSQLGWDLAVDVYEEDNNVIAKMNIPGIDPDNIEIYAEDDLLRVKGSREEETETKEKNYFSKEIKKGSFERTVRLPANVKSEEANAEYKDGVLKVILPKETEEVKEKHKIEIHK